ncbi:hypothetical protein PR048_017095 [Dryococelus australis]|uniref:Uncharacterized protein n=1 Tax=Dryococelus australis TaxID=614101 RepID=A0ABQ9H8L5_9NEOP|nr:hypothetical protein PR048_017095 [Dryococelus australis]
MFPCSFLSEIENEKGNRLPFIVSGLFVNRLLGVSKLQSAIANLREYLEIFHQISSMCFNTTAGNTNRRNGLPPSPLFFHSVINDTMRYATSSPELVIFNLFKIFWNKIDQQSYESVTSNATVIPALGDEKGTVTQCATNQLQDTQAFLHENNVSYVYPEALRHARQMPNALHYFKIWMFRWMFKLSKLEENKLFSVFILEVCLRLILLFHYPQITSFYCSNLILMKSEELVDLAFLKIICLQVQQKSKKAILGSLSERY